MSSGPTLMGISSVSQPPCASSPAGPGLSNHPSGIREDNGVLLVRRDPPQLCPIVPNSRMGFFSSLQSGARGDAWLHASDDSCWHACVIKANETARCCQQVDTGHRSNPPASTHPAEESSLASVGSGLRFHPPHSAL